MLKIQMSKPKLRIRTEKRAESKSTRKNKERTSPAPHGTIFGETTATVVPFPESGKIKRYIITSAQNNEKVHEKVWNNILALAAYYEAEILVGTYSYDKHAYGRKAVKNGTYDESEQSDEVRFDERIEPYIRDEHLQIGKGLVWCGKTNISPTAVSPLSGFETYAGRNSAIFPHSKFALTTVAALQGSGAKLEFTTGTVTLRSGYIKKNAGIKAEFHHCYGAVLVEVDSRGVWKVRQLDAEDETGTFYDLTLRIADGVVTGGHRVESITWGDIHAACVSAEVLKLSAEGKDCMLDVLRPKYQFIHDVLEGVSVNHHDAHKPLERVIASERNLSKVQNELKLSAFVLEKYHRRFTQMIVVNSNHDRWLDRWLDEYDPRRDNPDNAEIYHDASIARIRSSRTGSRLNVLQYLLTKYADFKVPAKFLQLDESFLICDKRIECGQHGDIGPNGSKGTPKALSKVGRRSNIAHTHTAAIIDGLYCAGTSTEFQLGYNHGPSGWTHSHIVTYPNGKRTIITMYEGEWRAVAK